MTSYSPYSDDKHYEFMNGMPALPPLQRAGARRAMSIIKFLTEENLRSSASGG